jgi:DNA repair protein RecO (recombination protein O)
MGGSRFFTTEALVIGSMRYSEADRIVTLYTKDRGRLGAIAKGVRRTKSKVGGRLEPFSLVQASLHSGHGLYTVCGVETVRTFQSVRDELFRLNAGAQLLGAVRHLFPAEEASLPAFNLLVRGVARLAEAADAAVAVAIVLAVRLKLLALLGYAPDTAHCVMCGEEATLCAFSPSLGGAVCVSCAGRAPSACFLVSTGALATLRTLLEEPLAQVQGLELDERATAEVQQVVTQTLAYHGH